ncbi:MAG: acylphosphatase [Ignavibacteria bacterium]
MNANYIQFSSVKIIVSGRVQGVGFRYYIARIADEMGLSGYAKNLFTGEVEIAAEGRKEFLDILIEKAKEGPGNSRVSSCKVEWLDFNKKYDKFETL